MHAFYYSEVGRRHVARHFDNLDLAGSHFLLSTFPTPDDLLAYVNANTPKEVIKQSAGKWAYCFQLSDGRMAGTSGIVLRQELNMQDIVREVRDGYTMDIGIVERIPLTSELCIVGQESPQGFSIITAFPGRFARPFAKKGQPPEEYALNQQFWKEHVLLRRGGG